MERLQNIDKLRGFACLLIVLYHCYALTNRLLIDAPFFREFMMMGGTVGVTIFFVLSGYGIYFSLDNLEKKNMLTFKAFMKARILRIAPQYYFNIALVLLLTSSSVYISKQHIWTIISHLTFMHSWSFSWHGAINGALWTMSVIFQFYLFAIPLYKILKRINNVWLSIISSVIITILCKFVMLNFLWVEDERIYGSFACSIPGRQFITSLDNFICGMCIASVNLKKESVGGGGTKLQLLESFLSIIVAFGLCSAGVRESIFNRNLWSCCWFSLMAVDIAWFMKNISYRSHNGYLSRFLLWMSKHEYGIYLWHLPILYNVIDNSEFIKALLHNEYDGLLYIVLCLCTIPVGAAIDKLFERKSKK